MKALLRGYVSSLIENTVQFLRGALCHTNIYINRCCPTACLMTGSVSSKHMSWLPARRSLPLHQKLSTLPLLKARSNSIYFYLKGFVGSAHGCYSMVCMTSTQFTKMTNRPSAEFTVHVYPLHFMFWTHQNLKKKSRANAGVLPKTEVLNKPSNHSIIPQQCLISLVNFLYSVYLPPFICGHASDSQQMSTLFHKVYSQ